MSDLRNLAERAASWQQNGDTPAGTSSDWAAFQRAASPAAVLALLDERDRLRTAVSWAIVEFQGTKVLPNFDPAGPIARLRAALQESPE